jgi:hypothetical protein
MSTISISLLIRTQVYLDISMTYKVYMMYMAINDVHGDIESEGIQPGLSMIGRAILVLYTIPYLILFISITSHHLPINRALI